MNLGYLSSTSLKARNFMTLAPHISTAPSQNTSETGVLELGVHRSRLLRFGDSRNVRKVWDISCLRDRRRLICFQFSRIRHSANISSGVSAHAFPMRGRGVPSTPHIHFFFTCFYLSLGHCEIKLIPSLPPTVPVNSLPSPQHLI